jgi:hypothetical protein
MVGSTSLMSSVRKIARACPGSETPSTRSLLRSDSTSSVVGATPRSEVISVSSNSSQVSSSIRSRVISSSSPRLSGLLTQQAVGAGVPGDSRELRGAREPAPRSKLNVRRLDLRRRGADIDLVAEGSLPASSAGFSHPRGGAGSTLAVVHPYAALGADRRRESQQKQ